MPRLVLKIKREELKGADPIPSGVYNATVDTSRASVDVSSNGTPYVTITFVISDGEFAGRKVTQRYYLSDKAQKIFNKVIDTLGLAPETDGEFPFDTDAMHGKPCRIRVARRDGDNGGQYNEVTAVMPPAENATGNVKRKAIGF